MWVINDCKVYCNERMVARKITNTGARLNIYFEGKKKKLQKNKNEEVIYTEVTRNQYKKLVRSIKNYA